MLFKTEALPGDHCHCLYNAVYDNQVMMPDMTKATIGSLLAWLTKLLAKLS
jgi:hypothetical protein